MPTQAELYIESSLPENFFTRLAAGNFNRNIYPPFSDRSAWESIRGKQQLRDFIADIFTRTETLSAPEILPYSIFREFAANGNRANFEIMVFKRRQELSMLVCAMCLSGNKDKYLPAIANYVSATLEEFTWTLPAHCRWDGLTLTDHTVVCLFTAEACATMALVYNIIGGELGEYAPHLPELIRTTVLARGVYASLARSEDLYWFCHRNERPSNWTIWCCANLTLTALLAENDTVKLADTVRQYLWAASRWAIHYPARGGFCDEGLGYFNLSGGMLANLLAIFDNAMPGSIDKLMQNRDIRDIFDFSHRCHISNHPVAFGDIRPTTLKAASTSYTIARLMKTPETRTFAAGHRPVRVVAHSLNEILRELCYADDTLLPEMQQESETLYPDRIGILRSENFSAALKAGNNDEHHNHNDLGTFVLYRGSEPLLIDCGTEIYAKINFSPLRYSLWYTRGSGHNAPVIGEYEQMYGAEYHADLPEIKYENTTRILQCDMSKVYPAEAGVKEFFRTVRFTPEEVSLNDSMALAAEQEITLNLITPAAIEVLAPDRIKLGSAILHLNGINFAGFEKIDTTIDFWGPLYKIVLKTCSTNYTLTFSGC